MLTAEQIDRFHKDGLLVVRGVFGDEEVRALQAAADEVTREAVAEAGTGHGYREVDGRKQYYRTDGVLWDGYAAFRTATVNPVLLAAVGQCLGYPFLPINDSLVVKLPHSGVAIPWHQDPPYQGADGEPRRSGSRTSIATSIWTQRRSRTDACSAWPATTSLATSRWNASMRRSCSVGPTRPRSRWRPGDVILHAISAPHGSRANDSNTLRRVFYVHFMAREVLETLHPDWVGTKLGFDERGLARAREMVDERESIGLPGPGTEKLELTPDGFVFGGETRHTPAPLGDADRRHGTRADPDRQDARRALGGLRH